MEKSNWFRVLIGFVYAILLNGCTSIISPHFGPDKATQNAYDKAPTFQNALALGASQRDGYLANVTDYAVAERGIGLGLITTTAVAADLAIRSISSSSVLALGLVSGAGYTASNWLLAKPQQRVFAAGANAAQCALDTMQPLYEPYQKRNELQAALDNVQRDARALEATGPDGTGVLETQARRLLARAAAIEDPGKEALNVLNGAAGTLRSSLASIQTQVTIAYLESSPQIEALLESLGNALPMTGGRIIGVTLPEVGAPATNRSSSSKGGRHDVTVKERSDALEQSIQTAQHMIDAVNSRPSEDRLKLCQVDAQQLGVTLRLSGGDITVQGGGAASTTVTGGVLPYRNPPDWIGAHPPTGELTPRIETGSGLVTVEAKAGAKAGVYQLQVRDAGNGVILLKVSVAGASTGGGKPSLAIATAPMPDPFVKQVQEALNGQKVTDAAGKEEPLLAAPLIADGLGGPITDDAMTKFLASQGSKPEEIPTDRTKRTKAVADAFGIEVPDSWSAK